jgi:hypothetical protein
VSPGIVRRGYGHVVLTSYDDFPIHQGSMPIAHTASSDINHYDRYFFNGCTADGALCFAAAMGLYPNRHVVDAAFSVVRNGQQLSVFASQRAPLDRARATHVGPVEVQVLTPLHELRITVEAPEHGLRAVLTFTSRSAAIEEPHFFQRAGARVFFDYTRLTQFGAWSGWIECDGERIDLEDGVLGARDRSWGVRPVGEPAPNGAPVQAPQFFWLWAPVNFPSLSTHFDVNEHGDGRRWHEVGCIVPVGAAPDMMRTTDWRIGWRPGTRWADWFEYDLVAWDGAVHTVRLEPKYEFMMRGLGYGHPERAHGVWQGESSVAGERLTLPVDTPCAREHLHVQAVCSAVHTAPDGSKELGIGVLEQLAVGDHPSGLTGVFDPA